MISANVALCTVLLKKTLSLSNCKICICISPVENFTDGRVTVMVFSDQSVYEFC